MKAVLFGATGFIGREVLRELIFRHKETGLETVVPVSRSAEKMEELHHDLKKEFTGDFPAWNPLVWDVISEDAPAQAHSQLKNVSHVFYSIQFPGHPVEDAGKGLTYARYDYGGLQKVVDFFNDEARSSPLRYVYLSGAGAGQGRREPWFEAKDRAESLLAAQAQSSGRTYLALRPSLVFGENDVSLNRFLNIARQLHVVPLLGSGNTRIYPIWVRSLADIIVSLGFQTDTSGAFDVPGKEAISFRHLLEVFLEMRQVRAAFVPSPLPLVRAGAAVLGCLPGQILNPGAVRFLTTEVPMEVPPVLAEHINKLPAVREAFARY